MPWRRGTDAVRTQCYPNGSSLILRIAGFVLIGLGVLLILLCVPYWAWLAIVGTALVLGGVILLGK